MLKEIRQRLTRLALVLAGLAAATAFVIRVPQLHSQYIRHKVGSQVLMITNDAGNSGGTGFAIKAPSGETYTLTNAHVCRIDDGKVVTRLANGRKLPLRIIEVSEDFDLCLLEGIKGLDGLSLANGIDIGDEVGAVGHPELMPLTYTKGQLIGYTQILVLVGMGACDANMKNPPYSTVDSGFFGDVCVMTTEAGISNTNILPGNSGSPAVNVFGNVVGVYFAGNEANWGFLVPLKNVKQFLKGY